MIAYRYVVPGPPWIADKTQRNDAKGCDCHECRTGMDAEKNFGIEVLMHSFSKRCAIRQRSVPIIEEGMVARQEAGQECALTIGTAGGRLAMLTHAVRRA